MLRKLQYLPPHDHLLYSTCWAYILEMVDTLRDVFASPDSGQYHALTDHTWYLQLIEPWSNFLQYRQAPSTVVVNTTLVLTY